MSSSSPMGEVDGPSFETLLKCQRKQSREERQVKRQANSITESIVEKRITSQFKPFSKTTRPPHTTRSKSSKPKLRPIFRGGTTAFVLDEDTQVLVSTPGLPTTITQRTTTSPNLQNPTTVASTDSSSSRTASTRSISRTPPLLPRKLFIPPVTKETTSTVSSTLFRLQVATTTTSPSTTLKPVPKSCVVDIIFLVDLSKGSGDRTKHYFDVGAAVVGALPIGSNAVRVGMIGYSGPGRSYVIFDLKKHGNKDNLIEELFQSVSTGGTTRTGEAISFATKELLSKGNNGARADAKKVLVVFTDGFSQDDPFDSASYARHQGIKTIAVAMMDHFSPNTDELLHIAGQKDNILLSPKGSQLRERILDKSCTLTSA